MQSEFRFCGGLWLIASQYVNGQLGWAAAPNLDMTSVTRLSDRIPPNMADHLTEYTSTYTNVRIGGGSEGTTPHDTYNIINSGAWGDF
jgi:hypothetical protein